MGSSLMLAASPALMFFGGLAGSWVLSAWAVKLLSEASLLHKAGVLFGRRDLLRYLPLWSLVQPYALVLIGMLGSVGRFRWKDRRYGGAQNEELVSETPD